MGALLAAALLAACTHGASGDGAVGASTTAPSVPVTTTVTDAGAASGTAAGTAGTGAATGTAAAGTGVAGTAVTDPLGTVASHPADPVDTAAAAILPGLYGLSSLGARVHGSTVDLASQGGCAFVRDVIRSGQWADTPVLQPHDGVSVSVDVLTRGDRSALLSVTGSNGLCTGRITAETMQPLTLSGTISASGPAHAVSVVCVAQAQEDGVPPSHVVFVSYRTGGAALLTMVTVPDAVGTHSVDSEDAAGVVVLDPHRSALVQAATTAKAFFDPSSITPDAMLPGVSEKNAWFQEAGATVTVTSSKPLRGTLHAPHLRRESGGGSAALSAGFSC